jgi:hypothetical protein
LGAESRAAENLLAILPPGFTGWERSGNRLWEAMLQHFVTVCLAGQTADTPAADVRQQTEEL